MDNNELLMIVLAFIIGYMASGMMKQMCGYNLVEGYFNLPDGHICNFNHNCASLCCKDATGGRYGTCGPAEFSLSSWTGGCDFLD